MIGSIGLRSEFNISKLTNVQQWGKISSQAMDIDVTITLPVAYKEKVLTFGGTTINISDGYKADVGLQYKTSTTTTITAYTQGYENNAYGNGGYIWWAVGF